MWSPSLAPVVGVNVGPAWVVTLLLGGSACRRGGGGGGGGGGSRDDKRDPSWEVVDFVDFLRTAPTQTVCESSGKVGLGCHEEYGLGKSGRFQGDKRW